jgi:type IV secretion system protein VirB3
MAQYDDIDEDLETHDVILALTRPPTVLGVPYLHACVELFAAAMIYLVMGSIFWLFGSLLLFHPLLMIAARVDPHFFDVLQKDSACGVNPVGRRYGVRTYGA